MNHDSLSKPGAHPLAAHQLVAHRGYQKYYPENTLLGIREAIAAGALHVELDVQFSRDQVPFVYHDDTLVRMSGRNGRLSDFTAAELQTYPAHEPGRFGQRFATEKMAPLAELVWVIQQSPAVTFYVELKEEAVRDYGAAVCLRQIHQVLNPVLAQCVLISFDAAALAMAGDFPRIGLVTRDWAQREEQIRALRMSVLFVNKTRIPAGEPATASCPVVVYEVGARAEALQWLQRGADKVESFAVGELLNNIN